MATYRSVSDTEVDHKSPATETLFAALRDNPLAIAEGASGAPRVSNVALASSTTTASVVVGASPTVAYITLGPYAFTPAVGVVPSGYDVGFGSNSTENADAPKLRINANSGATSTINVAWRRLDV